MISRFITLNEKGQIEDGLPGFFEADWETIEAYLLALAKERLRKGDTCNTSIGQETIFLPVL